MTEKTTTLGHTIVYEDNAHDGLRYLLYELDDDERKVFFDQAHSKGHATFENHMGTKYKLTYTNYEYQLSKI